MIGTIIAIEGGDGAGKRTVADALARKLTEAQKSSRIISFPRYGETLGADVIGNFLAGRAHVPLDPKVLAVFYAADRFESLQLIQESAANFDFVIMDRYVGSNVAYQGAKVPPHLRLQTMRWIERLELEVFSLPAPSLSVLLRMPVEFSKTLVSQKQRRSYTSEIFDRHEADDRLQNAIQESYSLVAAQALVSPWLSINPLIDGKLRAPSEIADEILGRIEPSMSRTFGSP